MNIRINPSALRETRWHEYLTRFVLGGLATVATGAIANVFGPETGGLFLAFPAIFSASATLIEKHERERKENVGCAGRDAAKRRQPWMLRAPPSEAWGFLLLALPSGCWLHARHGSPWLSARRLGLPSRCSYGRSDDGYGRGDAPPSRTFESDVRLGVGV